MLDINFTYLSKTLGSAHPHGNPSRPSTINPTAVTTFFRRQAERAEGGQWA